MRLTALPPETGRCAAVGPTSRMGTAFEGASSPRTGGTPLRSPTTAAAKPHRVPRCLLVSASQPLLCRRTCSGSLCSRDSPDGRSASRCTRQRAQSYPRTAGTWTAAACGASRRSIKALSLQGYRRLGITGCAYSRPVCDVVDGRPAEPPLEKRSPDGKQTPSSGFTELTLKYAETGHPVRDGHFGDPRPGFWGGEPSRGALASGHALAAPHTHAARLPRQSVTTTCPGLRFQDAGAPHRLQLCG